jgi:hypothetical protein
VIKFRRNAKLGLVEEAGVDARYADMTSFTAPFSSII